MSETRTISELEQAHAQAQARYDAAAAALSQNPKAEHWKEFSAAADALIAAERALSLARGQPTAVPLDWPAPWDIGASHPHVFANDGRTILAYYVRPPNPGWDGTSVRVVSASTTKAPVAMVEFLHCASTRFGAPNDEALDGHPLFQHGLEAYRAHLVENSEWIAELQRLHSVHPAPDTKRWSKKKHYLLSFKDRTFEVVAESFTVETLDGPLSAVFSERVTKFLARY